MKKPVNPFELYTYLGPKYFCDRDEELNELLDAFDHRRMVVLSSFRRLGKTSLIHHWHYHLSKRKVKGIYIDVMDTDSDQKFVNKFISKIVNTLNENRSVTEHLLQKLGRVRPTLKVDPVTYSPTLSVNVETKEDIQYTMDMVMNLLSDDKTKYQIAIDEFQQIGNYKCTSIDATLRSYFPKANNIHFLFSGSEQHLLSSLFSDPGKPLFSTAQMMNLDYIGYSPYFEYIKDKFSEYEKTIDDNHIHDILKWTNRHTFYTQFLLNEVFAKTDKNTTDRMVSDAKSKCLKLNEAHYYYLKKILSDNQWKLLLAIAENQEVSSFYNKEFLSHYRFSASSIRQALDALKAFNLVSEKISNEGSRYFINDVFLSRWLENYGR